MYSVFTYLFLIIGAAISQNIVLAKGVYVKFPISEVNTVKKVNITGALSVIISFIASISAWLSVLMDNRLFHLSTWTLPAFSVMLYSVIMMMLLGIYYGFIVPIYQKKRNKKAQKISPSIVFGFLPIAIIITVSAERMLILDSICYGLGSGLGVWLLMILNYFMQKRLEESTIPAHYLGTPITILTFGIVSMALFGLLGHGITL